MKFAMLSDNKQSWHEGIPKKQKVAFNQSEFYFYKLQNITKSAKEFVIFFTKLKQYDRIAKLVLKVKLFL